MSPELPRSWRWGAIIVLAATALAILGSRLVFAPVPWADGSAFYLPALELVHWPPQWRMHAQAAFVPSYDEANFNLMPALPLLLGTAARLGLAAPLDGGPALLIRILSLPALLAWAWLLWRWLAEALDRRPHAMAVATLIAVTGLWDPVLRWGTLVVRTETWIGLCWIWCLRELHRWEVSGDDPASWPRTAWRISGGLAVAAYFHFEAVYLVPAVAVGLGLSPGWPKRLAGIGLRTALLLSPWLLYVALHFGLFSEQMQIQFHRLTRANNWMENAYLIFHSLFIEHGSPAGSPKFFNLAKGFFWALLAALAGLSAAVASSPGGFRPRRALIASSIAFASFFYLWATKAEVWFITLCHLVFWPWVGAALASLPESGRRLAAAGRQGFAAFSGAYFALSLASAFAQARAISPDYTWDVYQRWVSCIESSLGPLSARPNLRLWQPHVPDVLVELSRRHPGWDLTRALDFPAREPQALAAAPGMEAIVMTRAFNPKEARTDYRGPLRPDDRVKLSQAEDMPFGPWVLRELEAPAPRWEATACEVGPFWAVVLGRRPQ